eukprot:211798_1
MATTKDTAGMLMVGILNIISCYMCGFLTYRYGKQLGVPSKIPWALFQISYGTMPFFGLWDNIVRISKYSNRDMAGMSAFFSVLTLMFLVSAALIDNKIYNITWNLKHILFYSFIIIPFWLILFLVPSLHDIAYAIYPICMLP